MIYFEKSFNTLNEMITIDVAYCFAGVTIDLAKVMCRSFGSEWGIARETTGSILCTKNGKGAYYDCDSCDTWRLLVFKSGSDEYGTGSISTKAKLLWWSLTVW